MVNSFSKKDHQMTIFKGVTEKPIEGSKSVLKQIVKDFGDAGLHLVLDPGLLKNIPVLKTVVDTTSLIGTVRDAFFVMKLKKVFESSSKEQRMKIAERLKTDEKYARRTVEKFLLLLDRTIDMEKCELLRKVIIAFAEEEIDHDTLNRLFDAIDRLFVPDFPVLQEFYNLTGKTEQFIEANYNSLQNLGMCGLIASTYRGGGTPIGGPAFCANYLGSSLVTIMQDGQEPQVR